MSSEFLLMLAGSVMILLASLCFVVLSQVPIRLNKPQWRLLGCVLMLSSFLVLLQNPGYLKPTVTWLGLASLIFMLVVLLAGLMRDRKQ